METPSSSHLIGTKMADEEDLCFVIKMEEGVAETVAEVNRRKSWIHVDFRNEPHPLCPAKDPAKTPPDLKVPKAKSSAVMFDPLSAFVNDPLSSETKNMIAEEEEVDPDPPLIKRPAVDEAWKALESEVIDAAQKFAGKIKIGSSFSDLLSKMDHDDHESRLTTVAARLEFLETGGKKSGRSHSSLAAKGELDRSSFLRFAELLNNQLAKHWRDDQRVAVIKLAIQATKLLGDPPPDEQSLAFYPSMFFSLADSVSFFGQLVYDRLVTKCPDLKVNFSFSDVSDQARELCKNWLYKIASVRGKDSSVQSWKSSDLKSSPFFVLQSSYQGSIWKLLF